MFLNLMQQSILVVIVSRLFDKDQMIRISRWCFKSNLVK
jgi:hypothetical protein